MTDLDALAESARNRGLRLARSRVRTPGKRRFGKVGLSDPAGAPVMGMDAKGPTATPDEVEAYLRTLGANDWSESLDVAADRPKRKAGKTAAAPPPPPPKRQAPPLKPKPKPVPPSVRDSKPSDVAAMTALIRLLDHDIGEAAVRRNFTAMRKAGEPPLVAVEGKDVVGLCATHRTLTIHRDAPLGRITILVVAERARGKGIGKMLVEAAQARLSAAGCRQVEVTSNDRLGEAHAFYRHLGFERTSIRFVKAL